MAGKRRRNRTMIRVAGLLLLIALALPSAVFADPGEKSDGTAVAITNGTQTVQSLLTLQPAPEKMIGDCDRDGILSSRDALLALQMSTGNVPADMDADTDGDGKISSYDAARILRASTGMAPVLKGSSVEKGSDDPGDVTGSGVQFGRAAVRPGVAVREPPAGMMVSRNEIEEIRIGQKQPQNVLEMIVSLPGALVSIISMSPSAGDGGSRPSLADESGTENSVVVPDEIPDIIVLPGNGKVTGIVQPDDNIDPAIIIRNIDVPNIQSQESGSQDNGEVVQVHMIDTLIVTPSVTLPPEVVMTVRTTSIANQVQTIPPSAIPCPAGYTKCSITCVDLQTDAFNCGACGNPCMNGTSCINGNCVARVVTTQPTRLGGVGTRQF